MAATTWDKIGTDVSSNNSLDEVLRSSGLDYEVVKTPIYYSGDRIKIKDRVATIRKSDKKLYGLVGPNYTICQNRDAFDFINYIDNDITFVKAGETYSGLVYIIAKLPEVDILGDKFEPYVIFQNGHNGGISLKAAICPLRIVCQNQFTVAFKEANSTINIRHTSTLESKLHEGREILSNVSEFMKTLNARASMLAGIKMSDSMISRVLDNMFKIKDDMSVRSVNAINARKEDFLRAYNTDDNFNFRGTAWGLVNAYSDYITHSNPTRRSDNWEENRFMYVTFNNKLMGDFISMVERVA